MLHRLFTKYRNKVLQYSTFMATETFYSENVTQNGVVCQLLPEVTAIELYGNKTIIMHGDTLCTLDVDYQKFRKKSRSWWWQAMIKSLPLFVRRKIAENYRQKSAESTAMKAQDIMDVTPEEVNKCLSAHQSNLLIHGHTHRPAVHELSVDNAPAKRVVLGDWYDQGSVLVVTSTGMALENRAFLRQT